MRREPGGFPTISLRLLATRRAAAPVDVVSLRVEGTDAGSMIRGKVLWVEELDQHGRWSAVGMLIGARTASLYAPLRVVPRT